MLAPAKSIWPASFPQKCVSRDITNTTSIYTCHSINMNYNQFNQLECNITCLYLPKSGSSTSTLTGVWQLYINVKGTNLKILFVCFHILILVETNFAHKKCGILTTNFPQSEIISTSQNCRIATFFMSG